MKLRPLLLTVCIFFSVLSGPTNGLLACNRSIKASRFGLVARSEKNAKNNANILVRLINSGKQIIIDDIFYVGHADESIKKDVYIKGRGELILTTGLAMVVESPVSICVKNIGISTSMKILPTSSIRLFENKGIQYHPKVSFENCRIDGVRVYSHVGQDVDQVLIRDGVKRIVFRNNNVSNIGYCVLRLNNCASDEVLIENNKVLHFFSIAFNMGVSNGFRQLPNPRINRVIIRNNIFDNTGYFVDDIMDYPYMYHTPMIVESRYCECTGNTFSNIISFSKKNIALYTYYLSSDEVLIESNKSVDCINLGYSSNNEIFKCKQTQTKPAIRVIKNNSFSVSKDCLKYAPNNDIHSYMNLFSLQSRIAERVEITNNDIDLACSFSFGAEVRSEYKYFLFSGNSIVFSGQGCGGKYLLQLSDNTNGDKQNSHIIIENNTIFDRTQFSSISGLLPPDCCGYNIVVRNNYFDGYIPLGGLSGSYRSTSSVSVINNTSNIGSFNGILYLPPFLHYQHTIVGGGNSYGIRLLCSAESHNNLQLTFQDQMPTSISLFHNKPESSTCVISVDSNGIEEQFTCSVKKGLAVIHNNINNPVIQKKTKKQRFDMNVGHIISEAGNVKYLGPSIIKDPVKISMSFSN